jgi:hypothetical protein
MALSRNVGPFMHRRASQRDLYRRRVIHRTTLKASGVSSTDLPQVFFKKAGQCFRRSRIGSSVRVELEPQAISSRSGQLNSIQTSQPCQPSSPARA